MSSIDPKSGQPVGNLALAKAADINPATQFLRLVTYVGGPKEKEITREEDGIRKTERHLPAAFAPAASEGLLGHVAFALKHEVPNLAVLAAVFRRIPATEVSAYVAASPTGAYARRIGFLYEFLTGTDLTPLLVGVDIGGNYTELVDPEKLVTGAPRREQRWRILNNLPGTNQYVPLIERTDSVQEMLAHDWHHDVIRALETAGSSESLMARAINYLYRKETKSSYEIERETTSETRTSRFIETLKQAGTGSASDALSEKQLTAVQNLIVDSRYAEPGFRPNQNYVGAVVRWENVIHFIPPPPAQLHGLMQGLSDAVSRLEGFPLAQSAVASFGFVFHHPFDDGNGRLHRYLLHDFMARNKIMPTGLALPVSAAILEDMPGYDHALEAFSKSVGAVAEYRLTDRGELTVANPDEAAWVWRYPDLTPQMEYLGRKLKSAVAMVAEEVAYLTKYDALTSKAKTVVELPDRRLGDLLMLIHENHGHLSNNKRKQRFEELTDQEIAAVESAYAEFFHPSDSSSGNS